MIEILHPAANPDYVRVARATRMSSGLAGAEGAAMQLHSEFRCSIDGCVKQAVTSCPHCNRPLCDECWCKEAAAEAYAARQQIQIGKRQPAQR